MNSEKPAKKMGRPRLLPGESKTRDRILAAALDLFVTRGFVTTSVREISKEVGLTESALYRHFDNKDAVLDAILIQFQDQVYQPLLAPEDSTDRGVVGSLLIGLPRLLLTDPTLWKISRLLMSELHHNERVRSFVNEAFVIRANDYVEQLIKMTRGALTESAIDVNSLAVLLNALRLGWVYGAFILQEPTMESLPAMEQQLRNIAIFLDEALVRKISTEGEKRRDS